MPLQKKYFLILIIVFCFTKIYSIDTLKIFENKPEINLYEYIDILEDSKGDLTIDTILKYPQDFQFYKNKNTKLNFGFSTSTFWLKLIIKNESDIPVNYILEIANPDLNHLNFYELVDNKILRCINTGELHEIESRERYHRNFVFKLTINPSKTHQYYISANNSGHPIFLPVSFKNEIKFQIDDIKSNIVNWLIYGLLVFVIIFNLYLYKSLKDKVNLYYALYVLFATITFINYDGYLSFLNLPTITEGFKWINPSLYIIFLASFTQSFTSYNTRFKGFSKVLTAFKLTAIIAVFAYMLEYPFSLIADIGIPLLILFTIILVIFIAVKVFDKKYPPSKFMLVAFIIIFLGMLIHELKEFNILSSTFLVENSIKFGMTIECTLLTIAVLERFRINQENSKKKIEENLSQIEFQNKELEIINSELEKLSVVASETNNSVAICDKDGRIEWCNVGFEKFYDISLDELIKEQKDYLKSIIPNPDILKLIRDCADTKKPVSFETLITTQRKKEIWVQTTLTPYVRQGEIQKIIAIDSDITNLKLVEKKLQSAMERAVESDRLKTVFLGNMSHEIRTPLNGILGFSELLSEKNIPEEKKNRYLEIIRSNGDQLVRIIDDIVDISLIESNQLRVYFTEFDLSKFYSDLIEFFENFKSSVDKSYIQLIPDFRINPDECIISSDMMRLKQVSMNLLKNAFKFTEKGEVKFGCYIENENVIFYVQDTGIGVDVVKKGIIFDRFRQGDESMTRRFGGNGLGLTISKGIIENLNGKIWVDQNYSDGFLIYFSVPVQQSKEKTAKKSLTQKNA